MLELPGPACNARNLPGKGFRVFAELIKLLARRVWPFIPCTTFLLTPSLTLSVRSSNKTPLNSVKPTAAEVQHSLAAAPVEGLNLSVNLGATGLNSRATAAGALTRAWQRSLCRLLDLELLSRPALGREVG